MNALVWPLKLPPLKPPVWLLKPPPPRPLVWLLKPPPPRPLVSQPSTPLVSLRLLALRLRRRSLLVLRLKLRPARLMLKLNEPL